MRQSDLEYRHWRWGSGGLEALRAVESALSAVSGSIIGPFWVMQPEIERETITCNQIMFSRSSGEGVDRVDKGRRGFYGEDVEVGE